MSYSETRNVIINSLGFFWTDVFANEDFVDSYSTTLAIQYNDLNTIVENTPTVKARRDIPVFDIEDYRVFVDRYVPLLPPEPARDRELTQEVRR